MGRPPSNFLLPGETVRIGLVQIHPLIGDFARNCEKILAWSSRAAERGCDLIVFPELALSGPAPRDLLLRPSFVAEHEKALRKLLQELPDVPVLLGVVRKEESGTLSNAAIVACRGEILLQTGKRQLSSHDIFNEHRYFTPDSSASPILTVAGHRFAVVLGEDLLFPDVHLHGEESRFSGLEQLNATQGEKPVEGIINIAASAYLFGKYDRRRQMLGQLARAAGMPVLYCNQVGGQDSLLFDGYSTAVSADGGICREAKGFEEDCIVVDTEAGLGQGRSLAFQEGEEERLYRGLVMGVKDYFEKSAIRSAVLGLSGGIDSALTAAVAVDALGAENLLCLALPSKYSSAESVEDAELLAANLGCRFEVLPIDGLFSRFTAELAAQFAGLQEDVTEQNLQARIRGILLMAMANKFGALLLTTGNKSELAVGYCTLYGDMCGGLAVIGDLPKQLVYRLAACKNSRGPVIPERILRKPPSAELRPGQIDQDDLPPYDTIDAVVDLYLEKREGLEEIVARGYDRAVVEEILGRIRGSEFKRKQAPMALRATSGGGHLFPNLHNYRG